MGNWIDTEGSTAEFVTPGWETIESLKPGDEVLWNRPIPRPRWYRPFALYKWWRGDRTELVRLTVKTAFTS